MKLASTSTSEDFHWYSNVNAPSSSLNPLVSASTSEPSWTVPVIVTVPVAASSTLVTSVYAVANSSVLDGEVFATFAFSRKNLPTYDWSEGIWKLTSVAPLISCWPSPLLASAYCHCKEVLLIPSTCVKLFAAFSRTPSLNSPVIVNEPPKPLSSTGWTFNVTDASALSTIPSDTLYLNESVPW